MRYFLCLALAVYGLWFAPIAVAQHANHHAAGSYAEMAARTIKALSANQIADLSAGRGMSLSLAAELNGYPGPQHVLDLANDLALDPAQRQAAAGLFESMKQDASTVGKEVIDLEHKLDRLFVKQNATPVEVATVVDRIGAANGRLRLIHLRAHLAMRNVLTPEQTHRYATLRGYAPSHP